MFIIEWNGAALRSAYEATIAVCDVRDEPFYAEQDYPAIAVQHRLVGGYTKHYADVDQYIASTREADPGNRRDAPQLFCPTWESCGHFQIQQPRKLMTLQAG